MNDNLCPKCGFEKADPSQTECPRCGVIYSKYMHKKSGGMEKKEKPKMPLSFKSKVYLFFFTIIFAFLFLFPWYLYLHQKKIEIIGERANCSVNTVRLEQSGKTRKKFAYYSFVTGKYQVIDSKYATDKFRPGDAIVVIYDPDKPQDNFPEEARIGFLYTLLLSLVFPVIYFGAIWIKYPNFREYIRNRLSR